MRKALILFAAVFFGLTSIAASASEATVRAAIEKKYPQLQIESVTKTPFAGIYEIYSNGQLLYADEKVEFLFVNGSMIDIDKKTNLTEERMAVLTAIKFDQLPLDLAFKKVKGKGTRKLAYFGDPNCGYCKKFEQELAKIDDLTVYVFLYPVLGQDSLEKSKSIWCSKDRVKAWNDQLVNGVAPTAAGTCSTPIDKILAFGKQKNISGTPTLFFSDGQRVPGAIPGEMIEQRLAAANKVK
jgi:thiol:disulfide interchange protein DsbC